MAGGPSRRQVHLSPARARSRIARLLLIAGQGSARVRPNGQGAQLRAAVEGNDTSGGRPANRLPDRPPAGWSAPAGRAAAARQLQRALLGGALLGTAVSGSYEC